MIKVSISPYSEIFYIEWLINKNRRDYNLVIDQTLEGNLDLSRLDHAIRRFVSSYFILNSHVELKAKNQLFWNNNKIIYGLESLYGYSQQEIIYFLKKPFDLESGPLYRFGIYEISKNKYRLISVMHHIIIDASGADKIIEELSNYYNNENYKNNVSIEDQALKIHDFSRKLSQVIESNKKQSKVFWQSKLANASIVEFDFLKLNYNLVWKQNIKIQSKYQIPTIESKRFSFKNQVLDKLIHLKRRYHITTYLYSKTIYAILLYKYTGLTKICVSYPVGSKGMMYGANVNTNVIVYDFDKIRGINDALNQAREFRKAISNYQIRHSNLPIHDIISVSSKGILNVMFSQANLQYKKLNFININSKLNISNITEPSQDLVFEVEERENKLNFRVRFKKDNIDSYLLGNFIDIYKELFTEILDELLNNNNTRELKDIKQYNIIHKLEHEKIVLKWNNTDRDYPEDKTINQLFEEQVARTPEAIAIVYEDIQLTYDELNRKANQLANYLIRLGVKEGTLIATSISSSIKCIVTFLGILKNGAICVPLDLKNPDSRLYHILYDSKPSFIIVDNRTIDLIPTTYAQVINLDKCHYNLLKEKNILKQANHTSGDLAYIIYTSGTTGTPKGVLIEHRAIASLMFGININFHKIHTFVQLSDIAFDASFFEIWVALANGAKVIVPSNKLDLISNIQIFRKFLQRNYISVLWLTKTLFDQQFLNDSSIFASIGYLIIGGEALDKRIINELINSKYCPQNIVNGYGPTENSTFSCMFKVESDHLIYNSSVPIGKPIANRKSYILSLFLNPVPVGAIGELYIGGVGLARGYLNRPDLTAEKFIANPFQTEAERKVGKNSRLYKTGDLVRWLPCGNIEYIGRNDFQVKIRGYRIELGEIESVLASYPNIKQAVVIARDSKNELEGNKTDNKYLVGYYTSSQELDNEAIRDYLENKLPEYMVPVILMHLDKLPLTINGKLDRKALPEPNFTNEETYTAPVTELEEKLCRIWSEVLGIPKVNISTNSDFFALGGNSILAIQLISNINKELNILVNVSTIFTANTVSKFIEQLQYNLVDYDVIIKPCFVDVIEQKLSFAQERLWFIEKYENGTTAYNIPMVFKLSDSIDIEILIKSIQDIISRHEILRSIIKEDEEGYGYQLVLDTNEYPLDIRRVKVVSKEELDTNLLQDSNHIYCLNKEYPIRVSLYNLEEEYYISIVIHHIAFDGWSGDILLNELQEYYLYNISQKRGLNRGLNLAPLSIQYKDFVLWQRNYLTGERLEKQLVYWKEKLIGYETLNIITDNPRPKHFNYQGENVYFTIEKGTSNSLRELAKELKVSLYSLLLSAYYLTLSSYSNQDDIVIGTSVANRHYNQIENLIGFFVNTLALRINIDKKESIKSFIERVGNEVVSAQLHQDLPFEKLVEVLHIEQDTSRHPIFQIMFAVQNFARQLNKPQTGTYEVEGSNIQELLQPYGSVINLYKSAKFDISTFLDDTNEEIVGVFNYAVSLYKHDTIRLLQEAYVNILEQIANHFESKVGISGVRIHQLNCLTSYQYNQIINEWNNTDRDYPEDKTINQLFEEQVARTPEAIAIVYEDIQLTYDELNKKANQLANYLIRLGVQRGSFVVVLVNRSPKMMIALLGVLKAGGAYIPLDITTVNSRLEHIVKEAMFPIIIADRYTIDYIPSTMSYIINLSTEFDCISKEHYTNIIHTNSNKTIAYAIYTSGTTGKPKGVMIEHQSIINYMNALQNQFDFRGKHIMLTEYSYDLCYTSVWGPILFGGTLCIIPYESTFEPKIIVEKILKEGISVIKLTPSYFSAISYYCANNFISLRCLARKVILGGEKFDYNVLDYFLKDKNSKIIFYNHYGPAEATVGCITTNIDYNRYFFHKISEINPIIGKPIFNVKVYVLNQYLLPLIVGAIGELYIGGVGLARGYLNRPDLTAEKFIANPFQTEAERKVGKNSRLYKTGDLVRWLPCGNIEYIGRNDFQVKIRGYRIELGEIESVLASYPNIKQAVVIARDSKNELEGNKTDNKYLVGYYTSSQELDNEVIRDYLENKLPEYMVPVVLMHLDKLPLTINGKLDRKALPEPNFTNEETYTAPVTELEEKLCRIWSEVLGIPKVNISTNSDFFALGGNSILAIKLVSNINKHLDITIDVFIIFTNNTIKQLADYIQFLCQNKILEGKEYEF